MTGRFGTRLAAVALAVGLIAGGMAACQPGAVCARPPGGHSGHVTRPKPPRPAPRPAHPPVYVGDHREDCDDD